MTAPRPLASVLKITPYRGGESAVAGLVSAHKLSANESPLGASPKAIGVYREMAANLHRYPDGGAEKLRQALARHHGLDPKRIICGNGSDELISLLIQAYGAPGDEVLHSQYGFLMFPLAALAHGATPVAAPETNYTASVDHLLAKVSDRTRLVFLANPNNPTGTYLPSAEVRRLRRKLPAGVLLVLDAAYAEYVARNDYSDGTELASERDDVVMTRTFSKIHGLAALRVGWAYAGLEVIDILNRVRGPFNVNAVAQAAAVAALADVAWTDAARTHNDIWLNRTAAAIAALGLELVPGVANFILIRFPAAPKHAEAAYDFLGRRGLILRPMDAYGLPDCLRLTIGGETEMTAVVAALKDFLAA